LPRKQAPSFLAPPPVDARQLKSFPAFVLRRGSEVHRIHLATLDPWYFNAQDTWRCSPCAVDGLGACYLAERPVAGLLETFKGVTVVDERDVLQRAHFTAQLRHALRLADCCAARACAFGVDGEIHTTTDYTLTQAWAGALAVAGFAGLRYLCRSDPGLSQFGYALFDAAGQAPPGRWPKGRDSPIAEQILREAEEFGLRVRPTP